MPNIYFQERFPELGVPRPKPAVRSTAKWWKDMDRYNENVEENPNKVRGHAGDTIRGCPAVEDIVNLGYTLFTPADIKVDATGETLFYANPNFLTHSRAESNFVYLSHHSEVVLDGYVAAGDYHPSPLRIDPYWSISTDKGYSTMFIQPMHRMDLPFHVVTAIVDTDDFTVSTSFSVLIKKGFSGIIPRGTPLVQAVPFLREDWKHMIIPFDSDKFVQQKHQMASVYERPYKRLFWKRKKFL